MVLSRTLPAVLLFAYAGAALAHQPPTPLRALEGGTLKVAGDTRVELVRGPGTLSLSFRDRWDAPVAPRIESLSLWGDAGLQEAPFEVIGHRAVVRKLEPRTAYRILVRFIGQDRRRHLLSFPPTSVLPGESR